MDFASSGYARDFFQGQVPQIILSLKSIADSQEKLVALQMQGASNVQVSDGAASTSGVVYVCYEENSAELYNEAGGVNHMFVTADVKQALDWAKRSLSSAEENNYLPISDDEMSQFLADVGKEQYASVWVYRNQDEDAKENYGICVDSFDLSKTKDLLNSMFA